jgi:hypothetical protein
VHLTRDDASGLRVCKARYMGSIPIVASWWLTPDAGGAMGAGGPIRRQRSRIGYPVPHDSFERGLSHADRHADGGAATTWRPERQVAVQSVVIDRCRGRARW